MALRPLPGTELHGRSGFFVHGRKSPTDLTASHGCVVMDRAARLKLAASDDKLLQVIA